MFYLVPSNITGDSPLTSKYSILNKSKIFLMSSPIIDLIYVKNYVKNLIR